MSKKKTAKTAKAAKARARTPKATRKKAKPGVTAPEASPPPAAVPPKPTKVNITAAKGRPMLTWVGKRPLSHVTPFPAQLAERHDALRIVGIDPANIDTDREKMQLFRDLRSQCNEDCWKDAPFIGMRAPEVGGLLLHGDNKDILAYLLANGFRRSVALVYIDPPFDSGADYVRRVALRGPKATAKIEAEAYTLGEQIQYTDIWANDNYLQFMYERLLLLKELLSDEGTICLHCDKHKGHLLRCLLDEVFGAANFRNEIIWYYSGGGASREAFASKHDNIYCYQKGEKTVFNVDAVRMDYKWTEGQKRADGSGRDLEKGKLPDDVMGLDIIRLNKIVPWANENTDFETQKNEAVVATFVQASSNPGDIVMDCFLGSGTAAAVAQKLGRRWIGCDINKGAIQTTVKRLRGIIAGQIAEARKRAGDAKQGEIALTPTLTPTLSQGEREEEPPKPCAFGFTVWRVNDYDLQIQHNEAVNLACEHIGIERTRSDSYFEGTLGKKLVKIIPFGHPLTPLDLEELKRELDSRPDEDRNIVVVCLGMELAAQAWIDNWNRLRKGKGAVNKIDVIELRTDPKYGKFIKHEPASARVKVSRKIVARASSSCPDHRRDAGATQEARILVEIQDFISPTIVERLGEQAGVLSPKIENWRAMVDCVYIDTAYNGSILNVALADVPERKADFVSGKYELPAPADETTVAVKIVDMLGEEVLVTQAV